VIQATAIVISSVIGVGVLPLPFFAAKYGNSAAPLVTLMGLVIALFSLIVVTKLGVRYPNKSIIGYSEEILGKWFGRIGSIILILLFMVLTGLGAREFGAVVISAILRETPEEITVFIMLFLAASTSRNDINTFSYIHTFYLPVILAPGVIISLVALQNANILYVQPILGSNIPSMAKGALTIAALCLWSFVFTIVIPAMVNPKKAMKATIWGMAIAGGVYLLIVIAVIAVFGPEETKKLLWPTLELARATSLPGNILQRLDVIFLVVWLTAVYTTLLSGYTFTCFALRNLFQLKDHKVFTFSLLPIFYLIALLPKNLVSLYKLIAVLGRLGVLITIVYPCLLLCIDIIRKKRRKGNANTIT
jgi:spore germination protein